MPAQRVLSFVAITALASMAGFLAYRVVAPTLTGPPAAVAVTSITSAGDPSDARPAGTPAARAIPDELPPFTLKDRDGVPRSLTHWAGRPLLVNFWATWCAPCRREIPLLMQLRKDHAAEGLEVIGVAVDFREDVLKYAADIGLDYPLLIGEQDGLEAAAAFGVDPVFPFSVFSDRKGRIVAVRIGELHADEAAFILARVQEIDAGRLALDAAQQQIAGELRRLSAKRAKEAV